MANRPLISNAACGLTFGALAVACGADTASDAVSAASAPATATMTLPPPSVGGNVTSISPLNGTASGPANPVASPPSAAPTLSVNPGAAGAPSSSQSDPLGGAAGASDSIDMPGGSPAEGSQGGTAGSGEAPQGGVPISEGLGGTAGNSTDSGGSPGAAGTAGSGSSSNTSGEAVASEGCGAQPAEPCDSSGSPCVMDIDGTSREFYVVLPDDYDPDQPYPVVFQYHPLGGNAEQGMNMYRIRPNFPDAIYVTPDGLSDGGSQGWPNTDGRDEALTRAIVADIEAKYCTDRSRYFSTGFSYGGSMSFTASHCMSDIFRAIGAMAGAPISGAGQCTPERQVAAWINHGEDDTALPMDLAIPLRDELVAANGCSQETQPVEPSPCVAFQGCDAGYPVVWCQQPLTGHAIPSYSPTAIAEFFQQF